MMTEEQKQQLIDRCQKHITWLLTLTPEAMTVCNSVKEQLDIYGIALAALTQHASQALKMPDIVDFSDLDSVSKDVEDMVSIAECRGWNACIAETKSLNAPHTAQIEPKCATGGAEWLNPVPSELQQVLLELRTYNPKADEYGGKYNIPGWADRIEKSLGINSASPDA